MGYSYGCNEHGNMVLACDNCGKLGGVRKRRCPHKVLMSSERSTNGQRYAIDYCPAPALCAVCYILRKPDLHTDCIIGASDSQRREDDKQRRLDAGDRIVLAAFGDWHEEVPAGMVGVMFGGPIHGASTTLRLVPKDEYNPSQRRWLSDYPTAGAWAPQSI